MYSGLVITLHDTCTLGNAASGVASSVLSLCMPFYEYKQIIVL